MVFFVLFCKGHLCAHVTFLVFPSVPKFRPGNWYHRNVETSMSSDTEEWCHRNITAVTTCLAYLWLIFLLTNNNDRPDHHKILFELGHWSWGWVPDSRLHPTVIWGRCFIIWHATSPCVTSRMTSSIPPESLYAVSWLPSSCYGPISKTVWWILLIFGR